MRELRQIVCVSPLGEKTHAARQPRTITTRPMMMLQPFAMMVSIRELVMRAEGRDIREGRGILVRECTFFGVEVAGRL